IAALAEGVTGAMFTSKLKVAAAVLLAVGLVAASAGVLAHQAVAARESPAGSQTPEGLSPEGARCDTPGHRPRTERVAAPKEPPNPPAGPKPAAPADKDSLTYGGRVLGPDGKPVAGAKLYLSAFAVGRAGEDFTTGTDG